MIERPSRRALGLGLVGGLLHAGLALYLAAFVRGESLAMHYSPGWSATWLATTAFVLAGLLLLGAIPVVLLHEHGLVLPLATLAVLFAWAHYDAWHALETTRETMSTPMPSLYADALFGLLWVVPLVLVLVTGLVERVLAGATRDRDGAREE